MEKGEKSGIIDVEREVQSFGIKKLIADAAYKTPAIAKLLIDDEVLPNNPTVFLQKMWTALFLHPNFLKFLHFLLF